MYPEILADDDKLILVAQDGAAIAGCLLAFDHPAFYANGGCAGSRS